MNWYFLHHNYCEETSTIISLEQFICENVCIAKNEPHLKSSQVLIIQVDSVVIRSSKPYLATLGVALFMDIMGKSFTNEIHKLYLYMKNQDLMIQRRLKITFLLQL